MTALVREAVEAAGLADVLDARLRGEPAGDAIARLRKADLLVLGALADLVRARDVGEEVRIHVRERPAAGGPPEGDRELTGSDLLRQIALARISGPAGGHVKVDWERCGLELAQVALCFGADELAGTIATKRGVPIADGELLGVGKKSRRELAHRVKRKELADCVRRSGRVPVFVEPGETGDGRRATGPAPAADARPAREEPEPERPALEEIR